MANETEAALNNLFYELIEKIKQRRPIRTDGSHPATTVYSCLTLGMPIWKDDYQRPWSPVGGSSLAAASASLGSPAAGTEALRSLQAAWNTALLCRTFLQVTNDDSYQEYPTGRHLDFQYDSILGSIELDASSGPSPEMLDRYTKAQKVLYLTDDNGEITKNKTPLYKNYLENQLAVSKARSDFAIAFAQAQQDAATFSVWPISSASYQTAVDQATDQFRSQDSYKVEAALDQIASLGLPLGQEMKKKARDAFDNWNLQLGGAAPGKIPYSFVLPTNWCDADDHQGFETLSITRSSYQSYRSSNAVSSSQSSWSRRAQSTGGTGGVALGFMAFGGSGGSASSRSSFQSTSDSSLNTAFHNTAKNLSIELEFGLCTIYRPWLVSDLFFMKKWYLPGYPEKSISDGTIDGQVLNQENLLPMIPQQFLVVRNVKISSTDWGEDGAALESFYGSSATSSSARARQIGGAAGVVFGFINFGGRASQSESSSSGSSSNYSARSSNSYYDATFQGGTLTIPGAQIIAFLCDIVPASPPEKDPNLHS